MWLGIIWRFLLWSDRLFKDTCFTWYGVWFLGCLLNIGSGKTSNNCQQFKTKVNLVSQSHFYLEVSFINAVVQWISGSSDPPNWCWKTLIVSVQSCTVLQYYGSTLQPVWYSCSGTVGLVISCWRHFDWSSDSSSATHGHTQPLRRRRKNTFRHYLNFKHFYLLLQNHLNNLHMKTLKWWTHECIITYNSRIKYDEYFDF